MAPQSRASSRNRVRRINPEFEAIVLQAKLRAAAPPPRHSGAMRLETLLTHADTEDVLRDVAALPTYRTLRVHGVRQEGPHSYHQFYAELDRVNESWYYLQDMPGGGRFSYSDGILKTADPATELEYPRGMPSEVQMLDPRNLYMWGGRTSFYPMLVQKIGKHSLLVTFEHVNDPAFRPTLVIDRRNGIATRMVKLGEITILTEVHVDVPLTRPAKVTFKPITDWIRPDY